VASKPGNKQAAILARTSDEATEMLLDNDKSPSPSQRTGELDNRGSHFYLTMYWAQTLAAQSEDPNLAARFAPLARMLTDNEEKIAAEFAAVQGHPVEIGGYYMADPEKTKAVMRPSATFNAALRAAETVSPAYEAPSHFPLASIHLPCTLVRDLFDGARGVSGGGSLHDWDFQEGTPRREQARKLVRLKRTCHGFISLCPLWVNFQRQGTGEDRMSEAVLMPMMLTERGCGKTGTSWGADFDHRANRKSCCAPFATRSGAVLRIGDRSAGAHRALRAVRRRKAVRRSSATNG
jgi:hypothetical protein